MCDRMDVCLCGFAFVGYQGYGFDWLRDGKERGEKAIREFVLKVRRPNVTPR